MEYNTFFFYFKVNIVNNKFNTEITTYKQKNNSLRELQILQLEIYIREKRILS